MKAVVSLVRTESYSLADMERGVSEAIEIAGGFDCRGASVLVKPNLLNASSPDRAVTTHPELLRAFLRALKRGGASRILVGDSPCYQAQDTVGLRTGIKDAAVSEGALWVDFSEGREVDNPEGSIVKRFNLAACLGEVDLLVSLPKLKTHQLMYYTGAIKNLFGLVPGFQKSGFHLRFPGRTDFGAMLADLALAAKPDFALMDAVVAMEGPGPNAGSPRHLGLLLASKDCLALDFAAADLIGYDPLRIPYLAALAGRGGFVASPKDIEVRGADLRAARPEAFRLIPVLGEAGALRNRLPKPVRNLLRDLTVARPFFDHKACVRCGGCVKICPAKALEIRPHRAGGKRVEIDYARCIRCYCCHEACPEDAIELLKRPW